MLPAEVVRSSHYDAPKLVGTNLRHGLAAQINDLRPFDNLIVPQSKIDLTPNGASAIICIESMVVMQDELLHPSAVVTRLEGFSEVQRRPSIAARRRFIQHRVQRLLIAL